MFVTNMVNDIIANTSQQISSRASSSHNRTCKKSSKSKKSQTKVSYNDDNEQLPEVSSKPPKNLTVRPKSSNKAIAPTKVKSASWKNSEKSIAPFNTLANKKHKSLRKKSPNWLKFTNSKAKRTEASQPINGSESMSAYKPGTSYSDVLFGAGGSNLVKIKNYMTPRFYNNIAQKKLTKTFFKFNGDGKTETSDESEFEEKNNLFPVLQKITNKIQPSTSKNCNNFNKNAIFENSSLGNKLINTSATAGTRNDTYEEADVVILSDLQGLSLNENNLSYGNYLEQQFPHLNGDVEAKDSTSTAAKENNFLISSISNIPKWNFLNIETTSSDNFPKFLCQFDDENYLRAEKIALLGLKLALGNNSP